MPKIPRVPGLKAESRAECIRNLLYSAPERVFSIQEITNHCISEGWPVGQDGIGVVKSLKRMKSAVHYPVFNVGRGQYAARNLVRSSLSLRG